MLCGDWHKLGGKRNKSTKAFTQTQNTYLKTNSKWLGQGKAEGMYNIFHCLYKYLAHLRRRSSRWLCKCWSWSACKVFASSNPNSSLFSLFFLTISSCTNVSRVPELQKGWKSCQRAAYLLSSQTSIAAPFACLFFQKSSVLAIRRLWKRCNCCF